MRRASVLTMLIAAMCSYPAFADETHGYSIFQATCVNAIAKAAKELVARDYKDNQPTGVVAIAALDDLNCHEEHFMANIAVKVRLVTNEESFAFFHIHATRDGKLASAAVRLPWTTLTDITQFKLAWCDFMQWREQSLKEQNC